jgi:hypothetical protein
MARIDAVVHRLPRAATPTSLAMAPKVLGAQENLTSGVRDGVVEILVVQEKGEDRILMTGIARTEIVLIIGVVIIEALLRVGEMAGRGVGVLIGETNVGMVGMRGMDGIGIGRGRGITRIFIVDDSDRFVMPVL